jgi:hypothetical protein
MGCSQSDKMAIFNQRRNPVRLSRITLAVILSATALSAAANTPVTSSASISNFSIELIDLDTTDGVNPWIEFSRQSFSSSSVATTAKGYFDSWTSDSSSANDPSVSTTNAARGATTSAALNGQHLAASGAIVGDGAFYSSAWQSSKFSLSANTGLIVRGHLDASATGTLTYPDNTTGSASVQIINSQNANPFDQISFYSVTAYSYNNGPRLIDENFTLSFSNAGGSTLNGTMDLYIGASGMVAEVPEPETYSMMMGGMALLGAMAYRRRRLDTGR